MKPKQEFNEIDLPGLNCGQCGMRTCAELAARIREQPSLVERCVHLGNTSSSFASKSKIPRLASDSCVCSGGCGTVSPSERQSISVAPTWRDSLGRDFDFYLEHFPEDPGPREIILPHNPMITRELDVKPGDIMLGRPLGMSCGCPITHCGVAMDVDQRTGVMSWCVTGPLKTREGKFKDLGYYIAEGYEGMVNLSRVEPKVGMRYYFQPRMCMLQWRHSGLVNYINRTPEGIQIRLEGLWIG
ncbi:MAG: (Fe-S)-binding protein [Opitutales bacterium]|nr:(Fe-S)-binding protein [Opitutales bacterium]